MWLLLGFWFLEGVPLRGSIKVPKGLGVLGFSGSGVGILGLFWLLFYLSAKPTPYTLNPKPC